MAKFAIPETIIVDTGIVYALADKRDTWHGRAVDFVSGFDGRLTLPSMVIPEACYLLNTYLGPAAEFAFIRSLINREMMMEQLSGNDLTRTADLMTTYADANIGFVDASLVAVAERLKVSKLLTTDRKHFSIVRPSHCKAFLLLP